MLPILIEYGFLLNNFASTPSINFGFQLQTFLPTQINQIRLWAEQFCQHILNPALSWIWPTSASMNFGFELNNFAYMYIAASLSTVSKIRPWAEQFRLHRDELTIRLRVELFGLHQQASFNFCWRITPPSSRARTTCAMVINDSARTHAASL